MKHILTLTLSLIAIQFTYSQKQIHVVDSLTGKGLPFATIECFEKKWGLYTDSAGFASIPENMLQETHKVSYVGYQPKEINFTTTNTITLNRLPQKLEDVTVVSCKETTIEKLEVKELGNNYLGFTPKNIGNFWAIYVPNNIGRSGYLKSLGHNAEGVSNKENPDAPVRIRFFEYDTITKLPSTEISDDDIIVSPKKRRRVTYDLTEYKIQVPANGIIVAFEMFDAGSEYHYTTKSKWQDGTIRTMEHYGWFLKSAIGKNVIGFDKSPGKNWGKLGHDDVGFGPAVTLEIKVCK
jgi:CarboxypepD_reg-like domain